MPPVSSPLSSSPSRVALVRTQSPGSPGSPRVAPAPKPTLQQSLHGLEQDLQTLDYLRGFGDSAHGSYHNIDYLSHVGEVKSEGGSGHCCENIPEYPIDKYAKSKSIPATSVEIDNLADFTQEIKALKGRVVRSAGVGVKSSGYISEIENYADKILSRKDDMERPIVRHDLNILTSEVVADVVGKLAKHPNDPQSERLAKSVLGALSKNFQGYLRNSEYGNLFFRDKDKLSVTPLSPDELVGKIKLQLTELQLSKNKAHAPGAGWGSRLTPAQAYQAAAVVTLQMKKPPSPPTRFNDVKRIDHHYHNHPYDNNGTHSKFSRLHWEAEMINWLGIEHTDIMPIPHQITVEESFGGRNPRLLTDATRHAYYAGPGRKTEFRSHDATMLGHHNDLTPDQRAKFNACATGLPVDARRIGEIRDIARRFSHNVVMGQLEEGRTQIAVNFGEITGYKPAVPQEILAGSEDKTDAIQRKFVDRSSKVLTAIFQASQEGISEALKKYQASGQSVAGIQTKTRITYHADALPNMKAVQRPENQRNNSSGGPAVKEATTMANIRAYARAIDANLTNEPFPDFPPGVRHEYHLQAAHLMGTSIESNNFQDPTRATELHEAFNDFRKNCRTLRVTADASWLTASARAVNCGMHSFFDQSDDPDLKEVARLVKAADDLSNNGFMFLHGGERFFEIHMLNGDHTDSSMLNMATMRAAQKKAVRTYHSTLGALYDKLQDPQVNQKLKKYVNQGVDSTGLVSPGNYPGLFLQLAEDKNTGKQDATPIIWGTDNLTASEARSGDLKMLQYTSQHGPLELILLSMGDQAKYPLLDFLAGSRREQGYSGARSKISTSNIRDGARPANLLSKLSPKQHDPENPLLHVRAPQDAGGGGALPARKERNLRLRDDRVDASTQISLDSKRSGTSQ